jgi:F-box-like
MSINNNRPFFRDSITDGWTKKDWALNLIPLGGIASVAYEIGSACLSPRAKDPCIIIPPEVVVNHIFSYLNLHELGVSRSVSRIWNEYASTPILWQSAIYREIAFSSKNWAQWDADLVKDVNMRQEMLSLPKNIAEELRRSAFPGKSIRETHVLVRMPKELTIKKLGELAKKYFPSNTDGYRYIWSAIVDELGDKPADESIWLLMTKDVLPGSRSKSYGQQKTIIDELAKTTGVPYQVPTTLEAATCILAEYSRSENRLFSDSPWTYTRCQENVQGYQMVVGGFAPAGLSVIINIYGRVSIGVAALRKF